MTALKLRRVGNSVGLILPKDILAELGVEEGDSLFVHKSGDGIALRKSDPEFERKMEIAREVMRRRHAVLRELAK
jgi:putative addiction module antidote